MNASRILLVGLFCGLGLAPSQAALGQPRTRNEPATPGNAGLRQGASAEPLQAINDEYNRQLLQIERQRLERLGQLAARQSPKDAVETYEMLFRLAIANNLFREAEPIAEQALKTAQGSPMVRFLAQTINIIAAADRGAYDESLADLRMAVGGRKGRQQPGEKPSDLLDTASLLLICDAYYQRLIQGGRFDAAYKAFQLLAQESENPAVKGLCTHRINQLAMIGKPAPPIQGTDLDGKPLKLADLKGDVVLIVFWASWCLPSSAEVAWLDQVYSTCHDRGFRIVGINLDTLQNGGSKLETVMPNVRRFLLDHNVRWPNLINGEGPNDYAKAYGVTAIPSNFLIGRDGTVIHMDLSRKNLEPVVSAAIAR